MASGSLLCYGTLFPDFFDVDKKAVSKTKKIVGVDEVAGNIVSVLKDQGYRHIGKRKISLDEEGMEININPVKSNMIVCFYATSINLVLKTDYIIHRVGKEMQILN